MRRSVAVSWGLSLVFTVAVTALTCGLTHQILHWMQTPDSSYQDARLYVCGAAGHRGNRVL